MSKVEESSNQQGAVATATDHRRATSGRASWLSAILLFAPLALLAELLISRTHHRPLGAATYVSAAISAWIVVELFTRRLLDPRASALRALARKIAWMGSALLAAIVLVRAFV